MEYKSFMEALKGKQKNLDKNKNGQIDAHDFKLLRKEETEELEEATVKTQKYEWGTMKTIHHGSDFSIPLHPEHHQEIAKLKDQQEHKFKTEDGKHWTAKRSGDDVHFQGANGGNSTTVKHSTMSESVEELDEIRRMKTKLNKLDDVSNKSVARQKLTNLMKSGKARGALIANKMRTLNMGDDIDQEDLDALYEVMSKDAKAGDYISDFVHSTNPKFEGKSKKERIKMALGAYYSTNKKKDGVSEGYQSYSGPSHGHAYGGSGFGRREREDDEYHVPDPVRKPQTPSHAPVAPVPDRKYIKGTPENKALKASRKPINGHPTNEEVELDEANHREFASQGLMHPDMAKHMKAGQEMDFYHSKTGDKVSGVVKHVSPTEVHIKAHKDGKMAAGDVHKFKVASELKEDKMTTQKDKNGKLISFKYEGDWKKSTEKKQGSGKAANLAGQAMQKMAKANEEVESIDEISDKTLDSYVSAARKDREQNKVNKSAPDTAQRANAQERDKKRIAGMNKAKSYLTPGTAGHAKNQARRTSNEEVNEAKDEKEYGYEGDMALNQLKTLTRCAEMIEDMLKPDTDLPEWVQSKITLATDYIQTAADYMYSEMNEGTQYAGLEKEDKPGKIKTAVVKLHPKGVGSDTVEGWKDQKKPVAEAVQKVDVPAYLRKAKGDTPLKMDDLKRKDTLSDAENLKRNRGVKESFDDEGNLIANKVSYKEFMLEYTPGAGGVTQIKGRSYGANYSDPEGADDYDDKKPMKPAAEKRGRGRPAGAKSGARKITGTSKLMNK